MSSRAAGTPRTRMSVPDRRRQILDAATALLTERGFWAVSLHDVAAACSMSVPGLLHHYASKDVLLLEVLELRDAADIAALRERLGLSDLPSAIGTDEIANAGITLATFCEALVSRNARQRELVRLYSVLEAESLNPEHPAHDYFVRRQHLALQAFGTFARRNGRAEQTGRQVLAAMDGLQLQWLRDPRLDLLAEWRVMAARLGLPGATNA